MKIRKNLKSGNAIVIALLVALVIGLIVALTITIVTLVKINNSNSDKNPNNDVNSGIVDDTNKEDEENNNDEEKLPSGDEEGEKEPEQQPSDDDKEEVDPYANYTSMKFGATKVSFGKDGYIIENGAVYYYKDNGTKTKIKGITGTPKKLMTTLTGGMYGCIVIANNGVIYNISDFEGTASKVVDLTKHNVIDVTTLNNYTTESIYFLTADGKLVDKNGVSYNKYNFVDQYTMGRPSGGISIDKNQYGYHYDAKTNTYKALVNKVNNAKLIMAKIYLDSDNRALIITTGNRMFIYNNKGYSLNMEGTVKTLNKRENSDGTKDLVVTFDDGSKKIYPNIVDGYDVKNKKEISVTSLAKFDPYANYKDLVWNTTTKVTDVFGGVYEIKSGKLYYKNKVVSGISGTPLKLKTDTIGGAFGLYIVTNANKVYSVIDDSTAELYVDLSKHEIIDMTIIKENHGQEYNYFLTATGNLIDKNGVAYDKNKFTDSYVFNVFCKISIDKNLYGYYYNGRTYSTVQDKASGEKIVLSKIYAAQSDGLVLIVSNANKLYEYIGKSNNEATYVGVVDKVYRAETNNSDVTLVIKLKDGTEKVYGYCLNTAYDVVNKRDIDLTKLELGPVTMDSIIVNTINDILALKYVDLKYEYPTKSYFEVNEKITVNGVKYSGLINYYKTVVPEVNETSSQYAIPEGYKFALKDNGSAIVIRKVD